MIHGVGSWGNPVEEGATGVTHVTLQGFGKVNTDEYPYNVANEYVASVIANRVGTLPVPGGALVEREATSPGWVSIACATDKPPPINPVEAVKVLPRDLAGVLVFDVLIGNADRHRRNLRWSPSRKQVFALDHGHALFGENGAKHLKDNQDHVLITGFQNRHCLLDHLTSADEVLRWVDEIRAAVSPGFLARVTERVCTLDIGVDEPMAYQLEQFLSYRQDNLKGLILDAKDEFKNIEPTSWKLGL